MNLNSFKWNTFLSEKRKQEIITWYESLTEEQKKMVNDVRSDAYAEGIADAEED